MKRFLAFLSILVLSAGIAHAKDYEIQKKAGEYDVVVKLDKSTPIVGKNNIEIGIKDTSGKYVIDAKVVVNYTMPAMPGMPAMNYKANAEVTGDKYMATMDLSMSGSWNVLIKITRGEKTATVKFNVDAR